MEVALTFGAVGDIISVIILAVDAFKSLSESHGSSKAYRDLFDELGGLKSILDEIDRLFQRPDLPESLDITKALVKSTVDNLRKVIEGFLGPLTDKYGGSLGPGGSQNTVRDVFRKIQWRVFKEKEVDRFRGDVMRHRVELEMLLQITKVYLLNDHQNKMSKQLTEVDKNTSNAVFQSFERLRGYLGTSVVSKVDFLVNIGTNITNSVTHLANSVSHVSNSVSHILTAVLTMSVDLGAIKVRLDRGTDHGEYFTLEDATGRAFPIHFKTVISWEAFDVIISDRFKGKKGERRIRRKLYSLYESASHQTIDRSANFVDAFSPYQKVDMSLICKVSTGSDDAPFSAADHGENSGLSICPWCKTVSAGTLGIREQCGRCKRDFDRRVTVRDELLAPNTSILKHGDIVRSGGKQSGSLSGGRGDESDDENGNDTLCRRRGYRQPKLPRKGESQWFESDPAFEEEEEEEEEEESDEENLVGFVHVTLEMVRSRIQERTAEPEALETTSSVVGSENPYPDVVLGLDFGGPYSTPTSKFKDSIWSRWGSTKSTKRLKEEPRVVDVTDGAVPESSKEDTKSTADTDTFDEGDPEKNPWSGFTWPSTHRAPSFSSTTSSSLQGNTSTTASESSSRETTNAPSLDLSNQATSPSEQRPTRASLGRSQEDMFRHGDLHPFNTEVGKRYLDSIHVRKRPSANQEALSSSPSSSSSSSSFSSIPPRPRRSPNAKVWAAKIHGIPPGYSLKNWDHTEKPILLLGSIFDANSIGKCIYDWAVYSYGPATPLSDMAGELWLLVIQVAGKLRRSDECIRRIRTKENRETVNEFIKAGLRVTGRFRKLLEACEKPILRKEASGSNAGLYRVHMSAKQRHDATAEFVEIMFGKDRELETTEKWMTSARLWNLRFDARCEDILPDPSK